MKKLFLFIAAASLLTAFCAFCDTGTSTPGLKKKLTHLKGTYKDVRGVDWGQGTFGTRTFSFDKGTWELTFVLALDPDMRNQIFVFRTFGTYKVLNKSGTVKGAYNALFTEHKKFVTLKTDDEKLAVAFGLNRCRLQKDIEQDISFSGCSLWKPVSECHEDHDLLWLDENDRLYFGVRPPDNNMCTAEKRPTQLSVPVIRQ